MFLVEALHNYSTLFEHHQIWCIHQPKLINPPLLLGVLGFAAGKPSSDLQTLGSPERALASLETPRRSSNVRRDQSEICQGVRRSHNVLPALSQRESRRKTYSSSSSESRPNLPTRPSSSSLPPPSSPVATLPYPPAEPPPPRPQRLPTAVVRRKGFGIEDGRDTDGKLKEGSWSVPRR